MIEIEALPPAQLYIVFLSFVTVSVTMLNNVSDNRVLGLPLAFPTVLAFTTSVAAVQIVWGLWALFPSPAWDRSQVLLHMAVVVVATFVFWKWVAFKTASARELSASTRG